ncbi:MRN complex-interacting protein [Odontesthes bonariensis]|uniref:MRN complex-interacting protein n=1 Tax=Odontesthes bonariensis TaxID=219752 RepID=UPI003F58F6B6
MVQEFHVLRCFTCQSFQVQQVKKANRWSCKLCGQKQSLLKEFGRGSAADCRRHVQKLNSMRGDAVEAQEHNTWSLCQQVAADEEEVQRAEQVRDFQVSRWNKYMRPAEEAEPETEEPTETGLMDRRQLDVNSTGVRKRRRSESEHNGLTPGQPSCGSASRWDGFPRPDGPLQAEPTACGWSHSPGEPAGQPDDDITRQRRRLPVSSMFESGEEFSFDEDFLPQRI